MKSIKKVGLFLVGFLVVSGIFGLTYFAHRADAFSSPSPVDLGTAAHFAILAGSAVTGTGSDSVTGDVGLSPTTGAAITLLNCSEVTGTIYDVDNAYVGGGDSVVTCLSADHTLAGTAKTALALA